MDAYAEAESIAGGTGDTKRSTFAIRVQMRSGPETGICWRAWSQAKRDRASRTG